MRKGFTIPIYYGYRLLGHSERDTDGLVDAV